MHLPITVTYDTQQTTPIKDVISALQATDVVLQDAVSLLPSLLNGSEVELLSISVKRLSQESPLREVLIATIYLTAQKSIDAGVAKVAKDVFDVNVPSEYQSLLAVVVLTVLFYGVGFATDFIRGYVREGPAKRKLNALIEDVSQRTGKPASDISKILDGKYAKPSAVKTLARNAVAFFLPSKREGSAAIQVGDLRIEPTIVADVPFGELLQGEQNFERFKPYSDATLELHAQDMDKGNSGWAAVAVGISDRRLRLKLMPPVEPSDIWGKSRVTGEIIVISRPTPSGYEPSEIHLTSVEAAE